QGKFTICSVGHITQSTRVWASLAQKPATTSIDEIDANTASKRDNGVTNDPITGIASALARGETRDISLKYRANIGNRPMVMANCIRVANNAADRTFCHRL